MDLLIVGIDGGDEGILHKLGGTTVNSVIDSNRSLSVEEDLWNRGWTSILSGHHCRTSGACYEKPKLDGSHQFTQSFGAVDYQRNDLITPLWDRLNDAGRSIGFMNVPTTMPAPEVNGFFVSGGGGGSSVSGSAAIPHEAFHPNSVGDTLQETDYILDTRFVASGIRDFKSYIDRLDEMQTIRTSTYIDLADEFCPDVGFIAYRALTSLQYLAMSEIEDLIDSGSPQNTKQKQIQQFYKSFDQCLDELFTAVDADRVLLVSDHAAAPYTLQISPDVLLRNIGLQSRQSESKETVRGAVRNLGQKLPEGVKSILRDHAETATATVRARNIAWDQTEAFGVRYVPGIYVNDEVRFDGPVPEVQIDQYVDQIVEAINNHPEAHKHDVEAEPYRSKHSDAVKQEILPDVWINTPDSMFIEEKDEFIQPNDVYGPIESLEDADRDQYTGIKGSDPLLVVDDDLAELVTESDERDLTLAYEIVSRFIEQ